MANEYVLVFNCGSSSIKFALVNPKNKGNILSGIVQCIGAEKSIFNWRYDKEPKQTKILNNIDYDEALETIISLIRDSYKLFDQIFAVGHRVVHGGENFTQSVLIDSDVIQKIQVCCRLAPLHNPANLAGIKAAQKAFPKLAQIAVFDTAFHQTMPPHAYIYPIPYELYLDYSARRYGFHGTSHRFVTQKAAEILQKSKDECAFVSAHLGNGSSAAAVLNGKSIDTTMGLTPLEGLMMGTRSGDVDPGLHVFLIDNLGYDAHKVTDLLNKKSGFLGVSGKFSDMREIEEAIIKGDERAILAAEICCYRLAKYIAALTVPLHKLDALIFTGGIGENSNFVRSKTLTWLKFLGFDLDKTRNSIHGKESNGIITSDKSKHKALVVATNEELLIAQDVEAIVNFGN